MMYSCGQGTLSCGMMYNCDQGTQRCGMMYSCDDVQLWSWNTELRDDAQL